MATKYQKEQENKIKERQELVEEVEGYNEEIAKAEKLVEELRAKRFEAQEKLKPIIQPVQEKDDYIDGDYYNKIQIEPDYGIVCLSLSYTHKINIICGKYAKDSRVYELFHFGDRVVVPYKDLKLAAEFHRNQLEDGYYVPLYKPFLQKHDLLRFTQKILDKDRLEAIVNNTLPVSDVANLYLTTTEQQQKTILAKMVDNICENADYYDPMFISHLSRLIKVDISDLVRETLQYRNALKESFVGQ